MKSTGVKSCRRGRNVTVLRRASHSQSEPESKGKKKKSNNETECNPAVVDFESRQRQRHLPASRYRFPSPFSFDTPVSFFLLFHCSFSGQFLFVFSLPIFSARI